MPNESIQGEISFINHEKEFVTVTYADRSRTRTINGSVAATVQQEWISQKKTKRIQQFNQGDVVTFDILPISGRDKPVATNIRFLYNNALDNLVNKALVENKFNGYLKKINAEYFVKETQSYLFIPVKTSIWEIPPSDQSLNEPVFFQLLEPRKGGKLEAILFKSRFIPEFNHLLKCFDQKKTVVGTVTKTSAFGVYAQLFSPCIIAKIPLTEFSTDQEIPVVGQELQLKITYISPFKLVVSPL